MEYEKKELLEDCKKYGRVRYSTSVSLPHEYYVEFNSEEDIEDYFKMDPQDKMDYLIANGQLDDDYDDYIVYEDLNLHDFDPYVPQHIQDIREDKLAQYRNLFINNFKEIVDNYNKDTNTSIYDEMVIRINISKEDGLYYEFENEFEEMSIRNNLIITLVDYMSIDPKKVTDYVKQHFPGISKLKSE